MRDVVRLGLSLLIWFCELLLYIALIKLIAN